MYNKMESSVAKICFYSFCFIIILFNNTHEKITWFWLAESSAVQV